MKNIGLVCLLLVSICCGLQAKKNRKRYPISWHAIRVALKWSEVDAWKKEYDLAGGEALWHAGR